MAEAAGLPFLWPEVAVVAEESLEEQELSLATSLPERPLVLGGCCCAHVGAVEGLSARFERLALVWVDAHGDLNTPETSPSGNQWGMPLRMLLDSGAVRLEDTVLVGARNLDPPEQDYLRDSGLATGVDRVAEAIVEADAVYVAFDVDVVDGDELASFMPEPNGMTLAEADRLLRTIADRTAVAGAGLTGLVPASAVEPLTQLMISLGL
jgi:arginase